jgi:hypothetical protein
LRQQQRQAPRRQLTTQDTGQRIQQLQGQARQGRLTGAERREMRRLRRAETREQRQQAREQRQLQRQQRRALRAQRVTAQRAIQGRFAAQARDRWERRASRRAANRAARLAARAAWRANRLASYVPWYGPVYWPYAYTDVFYYTFWPYAYEPAYWAFVFDDFFDGIFFPYGAPYVERVYAGPYYRTRQASRSTTGSASGSDAPGRVGETTRQLCEDPGVGVTAWPFAEIERAVQPTAAQRGLLEDLKNAAGDAARAFKQACPETVPMTPPGRLNAMTRRLQATLDAVKTVRPAMAAFYESLNDEQKARFNEIGPEPARAQQRAAGAQQPTPQANCGSDKAGLSNLAVDRIEEVLQPTEAQEGALDRLGEATQKAVDILSEACPTDTPQTPVGRLEAMQKRLEAMIAAANAVRPALDDFYATLSNEQKAKFNRLGRDTARSNG